MSKARTNAAPGSGSDDFVQAMNLVAQSSSAAPPAPAPEPAAPVDTDTDSLPAAEPSADHQQQMGRKEPGRANPLDSSTYADTFLRPVRSRKTKAIYVDEDTHNALATLTQAAGCGLADLLINITNQHFETYRPAIRQFLTEQEKLNKKKLPY